MSKPAKPAAAEGEAPKKSKKMLIIIIAVVVLLIAGGAAAFLLMKPAHPPKHAEEEVVAEEAHAEEGHAAEPKYVELGTFTANLLHEEGDRYLQATISIKLTKPELEEKIKARNPEILHRVNMLLQSRTPSELSTLAGKEKLAGEIKSQVQYVLGLRKTEPVIVASVPASPGGETADAHGDAAHPAAPAREPAAHGEDHGGETKPGVAEVLFTTFIIQ